MRPFMKIGNAAALLGLLACPGFGLPVGDDFSKEVLRMAEGQLEEVYQELNPRYVQELRLAQKYMADLRSNNFFDEALTRSLLNFYGGREKDVDRSKKLTLESFDYFQKLQPDLKHHSSTLPYTLTTIAKELQEMRRYLPKELWEAAWGLNGRLSRLQHLGMVYRWLQMDIRGAKDGEAPSMTAKIQAASKELHYKLPSGLVEKIEVASSRNSVYRYINNLLDIYNREEKIDAFWVRFARSRSRAVNLDIRPALAKLETCAKEHSPVCSVEATDIQDHSAERRRRKQDFLRKLQDRAEEFERFKTPGPSSLFFQ